MRAMILAAGRGERMRSLTDALPKPLLQVAGKALIQHQVEHLVRAGISEIVINHAIGGDKIERHLGDGSEFGVHIQYSAEGGTPLETAGGIIHALRYLHEPAFLVVNADVYTDFDFSRLALPPDADAHLLLVANPAYHPQGDFSLSGAAVSNTGAQRVTYSGIGIFRFEFFSCYDEGPRALAPLIRQAADQNRVTGQFFNGTWADIGTPERLRAINDWIALNQRRA